MQFLKPKFWDRSQISILAVLFLPISICFKYLIFVRRILTKKYTFSIPIICVGNIYLGGTGKTPLCIELFSILKNLNKNPAFIRKKYDAYQDEINLLQHVGPTYQSKKRLDAINKAINDKSNIAILDDGFQDFSIKKNISIICFNEKQWIGNGLTLPSGPLRENLSSLSKADIIIINGKKNEIIEKKLLEYNHSIKIFYSKYQPQNISELKNKKFICFAGIGNPNNFFYLLKNNNIDIIEEISFPDHYNYSNMELESLIKKSKKLGINLLTTEKDYLRINKNYRHSIQCLKIKIEIENKNQFIEEIKKIYMKIIKYFFEFISIISLFAIFKIIGLKNASNIGSILGRLVGPLFRSKKITENNIKIGLGNIDKRKQEKIINDMWSNIGRTLAEYVYLKDFKFNESKLNHIKINGLNYLDQIKKSNESVIFFSGHFANFELMAMELDKSGIKTAAIYRPLNNIFLNPVMEYLRMKYICPNQIRKGRIGTREIINKMKKWI